MNMKMMVLKLKNEKSINYLYFLKIKFIKLLIKYKIIFRIMAMIVDNNAWNMNIIACLDNIFSQE